MEELYGGIDLHGNNNFIVVADELRVRKVGTSWLQNLNFSFSCLSVPNPAMGLTLTLHLIITHTGTVFQIPLPGSSIGPRLRGK